MTLWVVEVASTAEGSLLETVEDVVEDVGGAAEVVDDGVGA